MSIPSVSIPTNKPFAGGIATIAYVASFTATSVVINFQDSDNNDIPSLSMTVMLPIELSQIFLADPSYVVNQTLSMQQFILNVPEVRACIPSPPPPNTAAFEGSLYQGLLAQGLTEASNNLALAFPLIDMFITTYPLAISQYWSGLKATNPSWLTSTVITMAEALAAQYNIPLVSNG